MRPGARRRRAGAAVVVRAEMKGEQGVIRVIRDGGGWENPVRKSVLLNNFCFKADESA